MTWTFTPRLTLQAYAQMFLLERRYSDFTTARAAAPGGLLRLRDLSPAAAPPGDPNEREGVINTNLLLRWGTGWVRSCTSSTPARRSRAKRPSRRDRALSTSSR